MDDVLEDEPNVADKAGGPARCQLILEQSLHFHQYSHVLG